jgi:hypothetical protein
MDKTITCGSIRVGIDGMFEMGDLTVALRPASQVNTADVNY